MGIGSNQLWHCLEKLHNVVTTGGCFKKNFKEVNKEIYSIHFEQETKNLIIDFCTDLSVDKDSLDVRLECSLCCLHFLQQLLSSLQNIGDSVEEEDISFNIPTAPADLLSIQQQKIIQSCVKFIFYSVLYKCTDKELHLYFQMNMVKNKFKSDKEDLIFSNAHHSLLCWFMDILIPVYESKSIGWFLHISLMGEFVCCLLHLCFCPSVTKQYSIDVQKYRSHFERILMTFNSKDILQELLLIKGLITPDQKGWLKTVCNSLIVRKFLMQERGVLHVLEVGLGICGTDDWKKKEAVANLVSNAKTKHAQELYQNIGPQIVNLVNILDKPEHVQVLGLLVFQLAERDVTLSTKYIFHPFIEPIIMLTNYKETYSEEDSIVVTKAIARLHNLYVEIMPPSSLLRPLLQPILCPIAKIAALSSVCHLRSKARLMIVRYLSQLDVIEAANSLLVMCDLSSDDSTPKIQPNLVITATGEGIAISTETLETNQQHKHLQEDEGLCECIIDILDKLKHSRVVIDFFKSLPDYVDFTILNKQIGPSNMLLAAADRHNLMFDVMRHVCMAVGLLAGICNNEVVCNQLFADLTSTVPFIEKMLRVCEQDCQDVELKRTQSSFLLSAMMQITQYINSRVDQKQMTRSDWIALKSLLPSLQLLKETHPDAAICIYTEQCRNMLLTHGTIGNLVPGSCMENDEESQINKIKCSVITENINVENSVHVNINVEENMKKSKMESTNSYESVMYEIHSSHAALRGGALLSLTKLIVNKDDTTLKNADKLLALFEHKLLEEDPYVYLSAVNGMEALCNVFPDKVIKILTTEFSSSRHSVETQLKLAEVLTRGAQRLGEMLPVYKNLLLNALLNGVHNKEALVRASSLSCLGEVCKQLKFSIGPIVHEVFFMLHQILSTDKSLEVRRSAVLLLTLMLQGTGANAFGLLRGVLLDIYRTLRHLQRKQDDDTLSTHIQLALDEIDGMTRQFLMPKLALSKKIYVTEIPPDML